MCLIKLYNKNIPLDPIFFSIFQTLQVAGDESFIFQDASRQL